MENKKQPVTVKGDFRTIVIFIVDDQEILRVRYKRKVPVIPAVSTTVAILESRRPRVEVIYTVNKVVYDYRGLDSFSQEMWVYIYLKKRTELH